MSRQLGQAWIALVAMATYLSLGWTAIALTPNSAHE
jgi:hypothetical protein